MDKKPNELENILDSINILNAGKKREEAVEKLRQLLPQVESFEAEAQRLLDIITASQREQRYRQQENASLQNELDAERDRSFKRRMIISDLE